MSLLGQVREWFQNPPQFWRPEPKIEEPKLIVISNQSPDLANQQNIPIQNSPILQKTPSLDLGQLKYAEAQAQNLAVSTPSICLECELAHRLVLEAAKGLMFEALTVAGGYRQGIAAYNAAMPYLTANTAQQVGVTAAKAAPIAKIAGIAGIVASATETGADLYYTGKFALEGNKEAAAISAANTTGSALSVGTSIAAGAATALAVAAVFATAPAWVPIAASVVVGAAVALIVEDQWEKHLSEPATNVFRKLFK